MHSITEIWNNKELWLRDAAQCSRVAEILVERLMDDRVQEECRYLSRLRWHFFMGYEEVSYGQLVEHVSEPKLAVLNELFSAIADRDYDEIDAWINRCESALPIIHDKWRQRSDAMHNLEHLFLVGEFPERAHLLSGLTLEQVTLRPDGASHSIYEELWHVVGYQQSVIHPGDPAGDHYPSAPPEHEHQWHDLVRVFLDGARAAAALGQTPERLALEVEPGVTMADELNSVAVHNAYHLGKIVALRQRIGAWPPAAASAASDRS